MGGMCDGGVGHIQGQTQVVCRPERPRRWNSCRRASSKPTAACLLAQSEVVVVGGSVMQVATRLDAWVAAAYNLRVLRRRNDPQRLQW